ncbi:innexin unc-9 [Patella vulgata]|uniref:innexin unc-9 n=1 Tax=Patella vulgata TaxID=6465 RepID=UPI0021806435|nr:innexin unc-9 [Patella vulgata]
MNNTYYVDMEEEIPKEIEKRGAKELAYYQWIPIILLFMAFLFKIPYVLWRIMSNATGFNVSTYVTLAVNSQYGPCEKHDERMKQMAEHLDKWLEFYKKVLTLPPRCDPEKQSLYGSSLIKKLLTKRAWGISNRFPLQTLCELVIRSMNNVLRFTVQCVLPINLFNEKIFLFLWFWLVFVSVMSFLSLSF